MGGGQNTPPFLFSLQHPKTAQGYTFKTHFASQTSSLHFELLPWQQKSTICKDIELKFGIETKFGPLSSKTDINLQFDVIVAS